MNLPENGHGINEGIGRPGIIRSLLDLPGNLGNLVRELHILNGSLGRLNGNLENLKSGLEEVEDLTEILQDFREMTAPLLGWRVTDLFERRNK